MRLDLHLMLQGRVEKIWDAKKLRNVKYLETYVMYVVLGVMLPVEHCTCGCDTRHSEAASLHKFCAKNDQIKVICQMQGYTNSQESV